MNLHLKLIGKRYLKGDFIYYKNKECKVLKEFNGIVTLKYNNEVFEANISDCKPIRFNKEWFKKFECNTKIKNKITGEYWMVKMFNNNCFYLAREKSKNPILSIQYVHILQRWLRRFETNVSPSI